MPIIELKTVIFAAIQRVFDLSRSIDLHKISTVKTNEEAVAGRMSGLIMLNESVTWRAKHFGITQLLTSKITAFQNPNYFVDEMTSGAFKKFKHEHLFESKDGGVMMIDKFDFTSPLGLLGRLADVLFLKKYMTSLLEERNRVIKDFAETDQWEAVLQIQ